MIQAQQDIDDRWGVYESFTTLDRTHIDEDEEDE
jgi:hypothetical protein